MSELDFDQVNNMTGSELEFEDADDMVQLPQLCQGNSGPRQINSVIQYDSNLDNSSIRSSEGEASKLLKVRPMSHSDIASMLKGFKINNKRN